MKLVLNPTKTASSSRRKEPTLSSLMELLSEVNERTKKSSVVLETYMKDNDGAINTISSSVGINTDKIKQLEDKIESLERKVSSNSSVPNTNENVEVTKQVKLRNNLCFHGIPIQDNEDIGKIVLDLCAVLNVVLNGDDFSNVYRTKGFGDYPGIIVLRLVNFNKKLEIMKAKRVKKSLSLADINLRPEDKQVFINNHVTPFFAKLMQVGRKAAVEDKIHSVWISKDRLCVKKTGTTEGVFVVDMEGLDKIISQPTQGANKRRASDDNDNPAKKPVAEPNTFNQNNQ